MFLAIEVKPCVDVFGNKLSYQSMTLKNWKSDGRPFQAQISSPFFSSKAHFCLFWTFFLFARASERLFPKHI